MNGSQKALRNPAPPKTQVRIRSFFNSRKLEKLVPSLNFGTTTPSNYVSSRKVQRESSIVPSPSNLFAPSSKSSSSSLFFFFFVSSDYFDEWIRDSKRGAFLTGSISREPPQFLWKRRMRTISIHPPRMDGRNFEGEATMMQVSDVFQWWALPVGMVGGVILSFASRFSFLFARKAKKWTKIYRYQVSFYYL